MSGADAFFAGFANSLSHSLDRYAQQQYNKKLEDEADVRWEKRFNITQAATSAERMKELALQPTPEKIVDATTPEGRPGKRTDVFKRNFEHPEQSGWDTTGTVTPVQKQYDYKGVAQGSNLYKVDPTGAEAPTNVGSGQPKVSGGNGTARAGLTQPHTREFDTTDADGNPVRGYLDLATGELIKDKSGDPIYKQRREPSVKVKADAAPKVASTIPPGMKLVGYSKGHAVYEDAQGKRFVDQ